MTTPATTPSSSGGEQDQPWYWAQFEPGRRKDVRMPPGGDLAALRLGLTVAAGQAPQMWPFYRTRVDDALASRGQVPDRLVAEHMSLALFASHQQGQSRLMHRRGVRLGTATRALHDRFSQEGVNSRMAAAAQARSMNAVFYHLRGLVSQLAVAGQPLDYTRLLADLRSWPFPESRARAVRTWGSDYHVWTAAPAN
ncbi:type I-E CRISPR-associated protein Cse2/CasB [Streptomyces sp. NBC_01754]|uniref:type I-E CRISPR-associated protein Cse2/CasB n=1 Tax=Streptomyces sp. NBC_01754 TaxID=2975930 RepID=UPI002DDA9B57|nr:type I-E CRISPR-associated protein Cse2/CasB [Streptomyces sp. NBC_01754]WSC91236.1 type I-E CRISPR-associated protein Cse2/CasB [Streptomyces sp. NBC_01754]